MKATPELLAALSHLTPGSIGTRLQNVEYLATGGAHGLSGVSAQTRETCALFSAARDAPEYLVPRITTDTIALDRERDGGRSRDRGWRALRGLEERLCAHPARMLLDKRQHRDWRDTERHRHARRATSTPRTVDLLLTISTADLPGLPRWADVASVCPEVPEIPGFR